MIIINNAGKHTIGCQQRQLVVVVDVCDVCC